MMREKSFINKKLVLLLVFILGLVIFLYPIASNVVHSMNQTRLVYNYKKEVKVMEEDERKKKLEEAEKYNREIRSGRIDIKDPYTEDKDKGEKGDGNRLKDEEDPSYRSALNIRDMMGNIEIPSIGVNIPIYHGTSERVLQKGVGHIEGSSLPIGGKGSHTALTAHRGIPSSRLFRDLDKLEEGDRFYIHNIDKVLAYQIDSIKIVLPWETESINIDENEDYATLVTCEPYMINTHRLLVRGKRIAYLEEKEEKEATNLFYKYRDIFILIITVLISSRIIIKRRK